MKSILQSREWAQFKKSQDFEIFDIDGIFVHKRSLPIGKSFLYVPEVNADLVNPQIIEQFKSLTKREKSIFIRVEFIDKFSENAHKVIQSFGFIKAFEEVQPKWRQIINISGTEEEILAQMKQKGRYNIRLAQKKGVTIDVNSGAIAEEKLEIFYKLYSDTLKREKISGRSTDYFVKMIDAFDLGKRSASTLSSTPRSLRLEESEVKQVDNFADSDYLGFYIANYQNEPLAAAIVSFYEGVASYLYGGSSRELKEVMAPYLMHWRIICDAKKKNCKTYDMIGRSAPGKSGKWTGVTRFKEQFGGQAVEILGSYDFVRDSLRYGIFKIAEKLRRKGE